jgi:hypothetical protein
VPDPTPADALAITYSSRVEGDLRARLLAEQIEHACRAGSASFLPSYAVSSSGRGAAKVHASSLKLLEKAPTINVNAPLLHIADQEFRVFLKK